MSKKSGHFDTSRPQPRQEIPAAGKTMKKELGRLWKEIGRRIEQNARPDAADGAKLRRLMEEYRLYAAPAWAEDWQQCAATVGRCLDAAAAGDLSTARALSDEINHQTKACHKQHK